jgi:succinyl-diaminopimelate desuccinylase
VSGVKVATGRETHTKASGKLGDEAGFYENPNTVFVKHFAKTIKKATGKKPSMKILTGGTDGISTSKISGIMSLGYGTSISGVAHQPNEYITIENLVLGIKVYAAFPYLYKP